MNRLYFGDTGLLDHARFAFLVLNIDYHLLLRRMKTLHEAGVIETIAALSTFAAVVIALLPTIAKWWYRPRLRLEIPHNHFYTWVGSQVAPVDGIQLGITATSIAFGSGSIASNSELPKPHYSAARLALRNVGRSPVSAARAILTDLYLVDDVRRLAEPIAMSNQKMLTGAHELAEKQVGRLLFINRILLNGHDSGFIVGSALSGTASFHNNVLKTINFAPKPDITQPGEYIARIVASGANCRAKTYLLLIRIAADEIKISQCPAGLVRYVRRADGGRRR